MKTLKRTLGLVLAVVMLVSLLAVSAGAYGTAFSDADAVQYEEAVAVLNGYGVINGYPDGTFKPTKTVTRAEAAKMICYALLGPAAAEKLVATEQHFDDVPVKHWASKYIDYCVKYGIVAGYGNGNFGPENNVTGIQLAAMLMRSVGYGQNGEFNGKQWKAGTQSAAQRLGVFTGTKATDVNKAATREETALYLYNAFAKIETVQYVDGVKLYVGQKDVVLDVYMVTGKVIANDDTAKAANGTTAALGISGYQVSAVSSASSKNSWYVGEFWPVSGSITAGSTDGTIRAASTLDYIGHVAKFAFCNGKAVAVFDQAKIAKTFISTGDIAADAKAAGFTAVNGSYIYTNTNTPQVGFDNYSYGNGVNEGAGRFVISADAYKRTAGLKVTMVSNYDGKGVDSLIYSSDVLYEVASVSTDRAGGVTVNMDNGDEFKSTDSLNLNKAIAAAGLKKGDIILVSQVGDYFTVTKAKTVSGQIKTFTSNRITNPAVEKWRFDLSDGNSYYWYPQNYNVNKTNYKQVAEPQDYTTTVTFFLDSVGNIIGMTKNSPAETPYYFIANYSNSEAVKDEYFQVSYVDTYYAQVLDMDGNIVKLQYPAADVPKNVGVAGQGGLQNGHIYDVATYTYQNAADKGANGKEVAGFADTFFVDWEATFDIAKTASGMAMFGQDLYFTANTKTIYVYGNNYGETGILSDLKVEVKTGFQGIKRGDIVTAYWTEVNGYKYVQSVFIKKAPLNVAGVALVIDKIPELYNGLPGYAWYDVYVNGKVQTLKIKDTEIGKFVEGIWNQFVVDDEGFAYVNNAEFNYKQYTGAYVVSANNDLKTFKGEWKFGYFAPEGFDSVDYSKAEIIDLRPEKTTGYVDGTAKGEPLTTGNTVALEYAEDGTLAYMYILK